MTEILTLKNIAWAFDLESDWHTKEIEHLRSIGCEEDDPRFALHQEIAQVYTRHLAAVRESIRLAKEGK